VCLQGPDVLHDFTPVEAVLAVHLLEVKHAKPSTAAAAAGAAAGEQGPSMFDPPLGKRLCYACCLDVAVSQFL
jgi:hypothetical protein